MKLKQNNNYKLGLYSENKNELLPISTVDINVKIINKFSELNLIHIYNNPYKDNIDAIFLIPKECVPIFKSLNMQYNGKTYEGIIDNKLIKINQIKYSDNNSLDISDYKDYIKKYLFFELKDIEPNQEIKVELSFIEILEVEKKRIKYVIPDKYIPKNNNIQYYNYKYEINVINTKKIENIFSNKKVIELEHKNEKEFFIKYNVNKVKKNNIDKIFKIEYEIEENNKPDLIIMKHPLYENDYACYFSINPKYIIEEKKEKEKKKKLIILLL